MKKRFNLTTLLIIAAAVVLLVVIVSTFRDGEDVAVTVNTGETSAGEDEDVTVTVTDEGVAVTVNTGGDVLSRAQFLQLVGLYCRGYARQFHRSDRHPGDLRRL